MTTRPLHHARLLDSLTEARSIRYNNRVYEMKAAGADVVTMSLGEAFFDIPVPVFDGLPAGIHHYSHSRGVPLLRQKLAKFYGADCAVPVDPDREILVTAGSKAAILMALTVLLEPGDEVIIPEPLWVSYPDQVRLCRGVPVMVPWHRPIEELGSYVTPRTKAIIVNNPRNPTGGNLSERQLLALHGLAERHGLFLLADEAYHEFLPPGERFVSAGYGDPPKAHTIICNSMSKNYGISGWRIGYVIADGELITQINKIQQHMITCAPTILCHYLAENFEELLEITAPQIAGVVGLRNRIGRELADRGISCMPGNSTFYLFASLGRSRLDSAAFADELLERHAVSVVPGCGYGATCDGFIRISVGAEPEERLMKGISAICELIERTTTGGP